MTIIKNIVTIFFYLKNLPSSRYSIEFKKDFPLNPPTAKIRLWLPKTKRTLPRGIFKAGPGRQIPFGSFKSKISVLANDWSPSEPPTMYNLSEQTKNICKNTKTNQTCASRLPFNTAEPQPRRGTIIEGNIFQLFGTGS